MPVGTAVMVPSARGKGQRSALPREEPLRPHQKDATGGRHPCLASILLPFLLRVLFPTGRSCNRHHFGSSAGCARDLQCGPLHSLPSCLPPLSACPQHRQRSLLFSLASCDAATHNFVKEILSLNHFLVALIFPWTSFWQGSKRFSSFPP